MTNFKHYYSTQFRDDINTFFSTISVDSKYHEDNERKQILSIQHQMNNNQDLFRFIEVSNKYYSVALSEVRLGRKVSHWMWYIFPIYKGLGKSETAVKYAIKTKQEAKDYLEHPILGIRLNEICEALLDLKENDPKIIFGGSDDFKLKSCMTLFLKVDPHPQSIFQKILDKFYYSRNSRKTLKIINRDWNSN